MLEEEQRYFFLRLAAFFLVAFFFVPFAAFFFAMAHLTKKEKETETNYATLGVSTRSSKRTLTRLLTPGSSMVTP